MDVFPDNLYRLSPSTGRFPSLSSGCGKLLSGSRLGDVAAYLSGGRIRFGTQDVDGSTGVWFILQRVSTGQAVKVTEDPGFFPPGIGEMEGQLPKLSGADLSRAVTALQERQDQ